MLHFPAIFFHEFYKHVLPTTVGSTILKVDTKHLEPTNSFFRRRSGSDGTSFSYRCFAPIALLFVRIPIADQIGNRLVKESPVKNIWESTGSTNRADTCQLKFLGCRFLTCFPDILLSVFSIRVFAKFLERPIRTLKEFVYDPGNNLIEKVVESREGGLFTPYPIRIKYINYTLIKI